jgi:OmpR-family two-component system manganese-sensing sensor histidine kinase
MFQATRQRLAIWYATVTAVLLLLFATGFYVYVRTTLIERIDDTLKHVVEVVERSLAIEPVTGENNHFRVNIVASFRNTPETIEDDRIDIEWFSPMGELLWSTMWEPLDIPLHPDRVGETVQLQSGQLLRQVTDRVQIGREVLGYLRVSHPWFEVTKPIRQLIFDLTVGTILMVIGVAAIGWLLSGLAMEPVKASYQHLKQFTADASHELRNPIATIQTNVQVALADPDLDNNAQRQQLLLVERLTRRLGKLVDDLLFLARQDSGIVHPCWETVHLDELAIEVVEEQRAIAADKQVLLSLDILDPLPQSNAEERRSGEYTPPADLDFTLSGDRDALARLLTNLVSNAVQYTPNGGQVEVKLDYVPAANRSNPSENLRVTIADTGIGIPNPCLPHIFERFYRVDPARARDNGRNASGVASLTAQTVSGSGLGLAIARAIVESHHGYIRVKSQENHGTTVQVILPIAQPEK